jgi:hypothetical protein
LVSQFRGSVTKPIYTLSLSALAISPAILVISTYVNSTRLQKEEHLQAKSCSEYAAEICIAWDIEQMLAQARAFLI